MSFEKTFCSAPWLHMRINHSGDYEYCRWQNYNNYKLDIKGKNNIKNQSTIDYFQNTVASLRTDLLDGKSLSGCKDCYKMEIHNKVSGRQRQLLKVGVQETQFEKTILSSPLLPSLKYSRANQGHTTLTPVDWQIDLGNYCNGACIYCNVESSSRLAAEFKQLGIIDQLPPNAWCDDPVLLKKFIDELVACKSIKYIHFLGGETVITPGFKKILQALIDHNIANNIAIGFTTNLTVWSDSVIDLLKQFRHVNLGMSVDALTEINDYVRYPSKLEETQLILDRWIVLGKQLDWLIQLRITPTCLTIHNITTVFEYAWKHNITVESCNFLTNPEFLRITVLPQKQRSIALANLTHWISAHPVVSTSKVVNTRNNNFTKEQIIQDANSYVDLLTNGEDESDRLPDLIKYLRKIENNRNNSILNYIPEYEELFRSAGY